MSEMPVGQAIQGFEMQMNAEHAGISRLLSVFIRVNPCTILASPTVPHEQRSPSGTKTTLIFEKDFEIISL
jgi:hypothetical protein